MEFADIAKSAWAQTESSRAEQLSEDMAQVHAALTRAVEELNISDAKIGDWGASFGDGYSLTYDPEDKVYDLGVKCERCGYQPERRVYNLYDIPTAAGELYHLLETHDCNVRKEVEPPAEDTLSMARSLLDNVNGSDTTYLRAVGMALVAMVDELRWHRG